MLGVAGFTGHAQPAAPPSAGAARLTAVQDVRRLSAAEAGRGYPVHLSGVVTYYDSAWGHLFVQDDTGGIFITPPQGPLPIVLSQRLEVEGRTAPGDFAPIVIADRVRSLGPGRLPSPRPASHAALVAGKRDSVWIELQGIVRTASVDRGHLILGLVTEETRLDVFVPQDVEATHAARLVDATVRVAGVSAVVVNQQRQSIGTKLFTPSLAQIEVVQSAPADAYAAPTHAIRSLLQFSASEDSGHRVKVRGVVTLLRGGENLFMQDESGGLYVLLAQPGAAQPGDLVEVLGFPEVGDYTPVLRDATFRKVSTVPLPPPVELTVAQAFAGTNDAQLVRLDARLVQATRRSDDFVLVMQETHRVFEAHLHADSETGAPMSLQPGSLLRLTGVCSVQVNGERVPRSFRLLLRSPADLLVLKAPGWWTPARAASLLVAVGVLAAAALAWVLLLRRRMRQQTEVLRHKLAVEAALQRRYQELFETANDIVYGHDLAGNFTAFNPAGERLLGYSTAEVLKLNVAQVVAPEYRELAREMTARKVNGEPATTYELELLTKDGRRLTVEINSQPILQEGRLVGVQGIARDLTARRRAERELEQSLSLLHATFESTAEGILVSDRVGRILNFNQKFARMWRLPAGAPAPTHLDEVLKYALDQVVEPEGLLQQAKAMFEHPELETFDVIQLKDGRVFERYSQPQRLGDQIVGRVCSFRDVTRRSQAEHALRDSEARFRALAETSPVGIWQTTPDGHTLYVNPAMCRLLEIDSADALKGKTYRDFYTPESIETVRHQHALRRQGHSSSYEVELVGQRGTRRNVVIHGAPLRRADGAVASFIAALVDITERVQLEEQFRQAQKMESIGRLAAGVAHDFNNMLTVILGQCSLLLCNPGHRPETTEALNHIAQAAERAANLTRQLLTFSRRQVMQPRPLNLNELVTNLSKMLCRLLGEHIALQCHYSPVPPVVHADPGMIEQVIMNLAVNARDAMPKGGQLTLATQVATLSEASAQSHPGGRPGRFVCLSVADTGCGIDAETLPRIFEPFFTTKEVGKGTGLGLATVYGIVQQHQGWIEVASEVGRGTTFRVFLPALASDTPQAAAAGKPALIPSGRGTVLLVEDEPGVLELAKTVLQRAGYKVLTARNGQEARRVWAAHRQEIDLLLTDIIMPGGLSGKDLADQFIVEKPDLKVIFSSGYSADVLGADFEDQPGCMFLRKPYSPQELALTVQQCLTDAN
jgi:PAS domain S-box-containing protein